MSLSAAFVVISVTRTDAFDFLKMTEIVSRRCRGREGDNNCQSKIRRRPHSLAPLLPREDGGQNGWSLIVSRHEMAEREGAAGRGGRNEGTNRHATMPARLKERERVLRFVQGTGCPKSKPGNQKRLISIEEGQVE